MKIVPKGFTAVTAVVYGASAGASAAVWNAYSSSISLGSNSATLTGNTALDTADTFSTPIAGDGTTYCILEFNPGDTTDDVYGGKITLKKSKKSSKRTYNKVQFWKKFLLFEASHNG